jgi:hypothetical protein
LRMNPFKSHPMSNNSADRLLAKRGKFLSLLISNLTLVTFAVAMIAVPPCGPYCLENCIEYPYLDILDQFPRDYLWIWLALGQVSVFVVFLGFLHQSAGADRKVFSLPGLLFGAMASGILLMTYHVQAAVVPISLVKEEYDGLALLTMYNEHGIFIAREEIAYLLMAMSLFLFSWIFSDSGKRGVFLRWLFRVPLIVSVVSLIWISVEHGLDRSYRFEVVTISANWLVLIVAGYSLVGWFRSRTNQE